MRFCFSALLVIVPLATTGQSDEAVKKEMQLLQGTWIVDSAEVRGKEFDKLNGSKFAFSSGKANLAWEGKGETLKGTYRIDPAKTPKHIDLVLTNKDGKQETTRGVYVLDGDEVKMCMGGAKTSVKDGKSKLEEESKRPSKVESDAEGSHILIILKRNK